MTPLLTINCYDGWGERADRLTKLYPVAKPDAVGDVSWAGSLANRHPFWLETPGPQLAENGPWKSRPIDDHQQSYDLRNADMNGDGDLDLLNAGRGSQNVVWYENPLR